MKGTIKGYVVAGLAIANAVVFVAGQVQAGGAGAVRGVKQNAAGGVTGGSARAVKGANGGFAGTHGPERRRVRVPG